MKISYTTLSVQDKNLEQAVAMAENWRLDGIELRGKESVHISPENSFDYVEKARQLIRKAGLQIPCLTAYTKFYQPDEAASLEQAGQLMPVIRLAEYLGAATVRTFMGDIPEGMTRERANEIARAGLCEVAGQMRDSPVRVVIETHDSVKDGASLAQLLEGVPRQIGVLLDIIHPWDVGETIEETWKLVGDRIYHVHLKDITDTVPGGRVYCALGNGLLGVEEKVQYLLEQGYNGFFSLEWERSAEGFQGVTLEQQMESLLELEEQMEIRGISTNDKTVHGIAGGLR